MLKSSFTDKDSANLVKLLNFVADKAKLNLEVKDVIEFYGLLVWAQNDLKKKIEQNVLEVLAVKEPAPATEPKPELKARGKK